MDLGTSGKWSRHNVAQRMTTGPYILWTYVPSLIFVLYGVLWQVVDGETKRLEKYRQLQSMAGCTAERTLRFEVSKYFEIDTLSPVRLGTSRPVCFMQCVVKP